MQAGTAMIGEGELSESSPPRTDVATSFRWAQGLPRDPRLWAEFPCRVKIQFLRADK
jgi:hypothetical protein